MIRSVIEIKQGQVLICQTVLAFAFSLCAFSTRTPWKAD